MTLEGIWVNRFIQGDMNNSMNLGSIQKLQTKRELTHPGHGFLWARVMVVQLRRWVHRMNMFTWQPRSSFDSCSWRNKRMGSNHSRESTGKSTWTNVGVAGWSWRWKLHYAFKRVCCMEEWTLLLQVNFANRNRFPGILMVTNITMESGSGSGLPTPSDHHTVGCYRVEMQSCTSRAGLKTRALDS